MDNSGGHLSQASAGYQKPITSHLLEIQKSRTNRDGFLESIIEKLECFSVSSQDTEGTGSVKLLRHEINALLNKNYIALSYTWRPSAYESSKSGRYLIQNKSKTRDDPSEVRNCVLDRITDYMDSIHVKFLWIDRHSIPQQACENLDCQHEPCNQKRWSLQCMDWVYKLSRHPVALLGRPISSSRELDIFYGIIKGSFVTQDGEGGGLTFKREVDRQRAECILDLLYEITSDLWWQRAWTFQENYKGGIAMTLLIKHPHSLERKKRDCGIFGKVRGELSIRSVDFSYKATRFCAAFRGTQDPTLEESEKIVQILNGTEKYTETLQWSEPMYPAIIANVEERDVQYPWDRIPIVANCSDYPVRLDVQKLEKEDHSLSLSILATCLLNGEIFYNKPSGDPESDLSVSQFLKEYHFNKFCSPPLERCLTYNKNCRFIEVEFIKAGIQTIGHVWELGPIIQTAGLESKTRFFDVKTSECEKYIVEHLTYLFRKLDSLSYTELAGSIKEYSKIIDKKKDIYKFRVRYMSKMAMAVAKAIEEGKALRLGRLWKRKGDPNPFKAIFVWEDTSNEDPAFVFTSIHRGKSVDDTDHHVTLQVDLQNIEDDVPHLYVNRWLLGMCFWEGAHLEEVVFPWPSALKHLRP
ncbi:hypothetical protein F4774DRAFT_367168 [Daldinia eschscholtzii]|nr:hypothetical protein F4774DRAFT_367168 [Daldinia eschscholtzii]